MILPSNQEPNLQPVEPQSVESLSVGQTRKEVITQIWKLCNELRDLDLAKRMAEIDVQFYKTLFAQQLYDQAVEKLQRTLAKTTSLAQSLNQLPVEEHNIIFHPPHQLIELPEDELLAEAKAFMLNKINKVNLYDNTEVPSSIIKYFENTLQRTQGITIGEAHDDKVMLFITAELANLKKMGVGTIFLEGLRYDLQKEIDEENWESIKDQVFYTNEITIKFIQLAHKEGIKVVGLETKNTHQGGGADRLICFNYMASKIINDEEAKEKFIILVGSAHGTSLYNGAISGISELTGAPCIEIYDENEAQKRQAMQQSAFGETRTKPAAVFTLN